MGKWALQSPQAQSEAWEVGLVDSNGWDYKRIPIPTWQTDPTSLASPTPWPPRTPGVVNPVHELPTPFSAEWLVRLRNPEFPSLPDSCRRGWPKLSDASCLVFTSFRKQAQCVWFNRSQCESDRCEPKSDFAVAAFPMFVLCLATSGLPRTASFYHFWQPIILGYIFIHGDKVQHSLPNIPFFIIEIRADLSSDLFI